MSAPRKVVVTIAVLAAVVATACGSQSPRTLTIDNRTEQRLSVDVSNGDGARLPLLTLDGGTKDTVDEVADQGDTWVFEFESTDGTPTGKITLTRAQLDEREWIVVIR